MTAVRNTKAVLAALDQNQKDLVDLTRYLSKARTMSEIMTAVTAAFALGFENGCGTYEPKQDEADDGESVVPSRSPEKQAHEFNRLFPVGTKVRYWRGAREGLGRETVTRSKARVLSGHTAVVLLEGVSDCIALSHVEPLP